MIPFSAYQLYQAERALNDAERRRADSRAGELAATLAQLRASVGRRASALLDRFPRALIASGVRTSTGGRARRLHWDNAGASPKCA